MCCILKENTRVFLLSKSGGTPLALLQHNVWETLILFYYATLLSVNAVISLEMR